MLLHSRVTGTAPDDGARPAPLRATAQLLYAILFLWLRMCGGLLLRRYVQVCPCVCSHV